jgi:phage terminase large subunit
VQSKAQFPQKLDFLFKPSRYKCIYGGRGSGKSWGVARAILILGAQRKLRVLCTREIQKSIQQSVHQLLSDQVQSMGLESFYDILQTEIRGKNGTEIYFSGLSNETATSLKSFEGVDICWCEEAQTISKHSWDILLPTIRGNNSEIWVTYNPELDTDETHMRFVIHPPPDCVTVKMNYQDNPWFPDVLERERVHAQNTMRVEDYQWIWEGNCKPAVEGAIYFEQVSLAENEGRITNVPYNPMLKVHCVWDLGWNDATSIILVQRNVSEILIIDYIEDTRLKLDDYSAILKERRYNWGNTYLPHDGYNEDVKANSAYKILTALGWTIQPRESLIEMGVEEGIKAARMVFGRCYFDKTKAARLIECLKRYRRTVSKTTMEAGSPLHDEFSHGADAFRYLSVSVDQMNNSDWTSSKLNYPSLGIF